MNPTAKAYFHFGGDVITTIDPVTDLPGLRNGEYVFLDRSYHVVEVAHDYSDLIDDDEDDKVKIHIHLAEDA